MNNKNNAAVPDYPSYPKRFLPYKWYKPLIVLLIGVAVWGVFTSIIMGIAYILDPDAVANAMKGSYDTMDSYSPAGAIFTFGQILCFIPAIMIANRIVNARPFSSYSSSRGGFNWAAFLKSFGVVLILFALPLCIITFLTDEHTGEIKFSIAGLILCVILCPLQCAAEEYLFRGYAMQTIGSWCKFPVVAIVLQAVLFAAMHPYNLVGVISTFIMGVILGVIAYYTKGLEASCALHIANNLISFLFAGFGIGGVKTDVPVMEVVVVCVLALVYLGFTVFASKKLGWYSKIKKDDVTPFNEKIEAKKAKKAQA